MSSPFEIVMSPADVYVAPVGTAFPAIDAAPGASWRLLGKNGKENYSEDGITVRHESEYAEHRGAGSTGKKKVRRISEDHSISGVLNDLTLETYGTVMNNTIASDTTAASGVAGKKSMTLYQGLDVAEFAVLVRGDSAYGDWYNGQYIIPRAYQAENPEVVFTKEKAAGLAFRFEALEDPNSVPEERFGRLEMQTAAALP